MEIKGQDSKYADSAVRSCRAGAQRHAIPLDCTIFLKIFLVIFNISDDYLFTSLKLAKQCSKPNRQGLGGLYFDQYAKARI